jgi:hypothetical protein
MFLHIEICDVISIPQLFLLRERESEEEEEEEEEEKEEEAYTLKASSTHIVQAVIVLIYAKLYKLTVISYVSGRF